MSFSTYTEFRNFVYEYCNRRSTYIEENFDYFLLKGTHEFIKRCLPLGASKRIDFSHQTSGQPRNFLKTFIGGLYLTLGDIKTNLSLIPYAIEEINIFKQEVVDGNSYTHFRNLPYIRLGWPMRSWVSGGEIGGGYYIDFWSFQIQDRTDNGFVFYFFIPSVSNIQQVKIYIQGLWLPLNLSQDEVIWKNYDEEIALFTYYVILRALNEWAEMQIVWSECEKKIAEMRSGQGTRRFLFPFQYADYLLQVPKLQTQQVGGR